MPRILGLVSAVAASAVLSASVVLGASQMPRQETTIAQTVAPATVIDRSAKGDRLNAGGSSIAKTPRGPSAPRQLLAGCDPLVSPLADPVVSRQAQRCAT